ncbi:SGNH hydrolase-type esterase domain-containing protein [Dipodascopsis tothii]|uniref:SGNH hydrolase-type esterase domain-containing protein n=1 Tax=Dipodascopsis tothii TaxID=44089 RepID=UPI0034CFAECC
MASIPSVKGLLQGPVPALPYKKIVLFGDSQFERSSNPALEFSFTSALSNAFARRADVLNRGVSGYNTEWLVDQFRRIVHELTPVAADVALVVVWIGTNDACLADTPHHVPLDRYKANMVVYVEALLQVFPLAKLVLVSPGPISRQQLIDCSTRPGQAGDRDLETYADALLGLPVAGERVQLVDLYRPIVAAARATLSAGADALDTAAGSPLDTALAAFYLDGLHFNGKGYAVLYEQVQRALEAWPELGVPHTPLVEPWWGDRSEVAAFRQSHPN